MKRWSDLMIYWPWFLLHRAKVASWPRHATTYLSWDCRMSSWWSGLRRCSDETWTLSCSSRRWRCWRMRTQRWRTRMHWYGPSCSSKASWLNYPHNSGKLQGMASGLAPASTLVAPLWIDNLYTYKKKVIKKWDICKLWYENYIYVKSLRCSLSWALVWTNLYVVKELLMVTYCNQPLALLQGVRHAPLQGGTACFVLDDLTALI